MSRAGRRYRAGDRWNATGAQTRQPAFTDGFAPAAPQQPAI